MQVLSKSDQAQVHVAVYWSRAVYCSCVSLLWGKFESRKPGSSYLQAAHPSTFPTPQRPLSNLRYNHRKCNRHVSWYLKAYLPVKHHWRKSVSWEESQAKHAAESPSWTPQSSELLYFSTDPTRTGWQEAQACWCDQNPMAQVMSLNIAILHCFWPQIHSRLRKTPQAPALR